MKEKCYLWATRVKTYGDGTTNEYEPVCILNAQAPLIMSKVHFTSLKAATYIEAEIVNVICLILNRQNIKKFEEEIYRFPPNIVVTCTNMAIGNHPGAEFLQPKSKMPFMVDDYPMFIPFLDLKKLASHPYVADVRKRKFYILDLYHKTCPSEARTKLNKFVGYVEVDHFRVEFASRILFHEMNRDRDEAIRGSEALRLSKPSLLLLSPYCQIDS
ncbi:hypothetical protein Ahy_B07g086936 [Arachis hypogaea]|uniref:Uncharacterized protein n=1 Tax=Arachis hypogaea TaxID=3818 RepID=A0A444YAV7_ARAHY|nr:hypothetical protein Ahy_B07g086936 [Arachis hypogaea]